MLQLLDGIHEDYRPSAEATAFAEKNVALTREKHPIASTPLIKAHYDIVRVFGVLVFQQENDHNSFAGIARGHKDVWKAMLAWMYDKGIVTSEPVSPTN